jgi:DNA primase
LRRDYNEVVNLMEIETRKRRSPEWQIDLAELKASVPIDAVVRYYIPWVKTTKENIRCPFHDERSGSLHIYHQTNTFKCFGCWKWGTQIDWIMLSDKCDVKTAINKLKSFT